MRLPFFAAPRFEPNPVWLREMRQAARLTRTPVILSTVTAIAGLLVCAVGGAASSSAPPAEVGTVLFQTFFSIAFAIVAWLGPGVAALTVVSERTGRTWESIVLTGLPPRSVALGKFLAGVTYIGLYLAALAPVGALPFLFGGVTATEVVVAFALLAVFAVLAVGFGLAVSSGATTPAMALLVTLPLSVGGSLFTYFGLGLGLSVAVHDLWPSVTQGTPVWLPTAYARAPFDTNYGLFLIVLPLAVTVLLAALFREVTVANLSDNSDDRSTGTKRWFVGASATVTLFGIVWLVIAPGAPWIVALFAMAAAGLLSLFALFVLAADPAGPSQRVLALWDRERASLFRRFFGPGLGNTALLIVLVTAASQSVLGLAGTFLELRASSAAAHDHVASIAVVGGYISCFLAFLAGFTTYTRLRENPRFSPRALLGLVLFAVVTGPLFALAILGLSLSAWDTVYFAGAPSPLYMIAMLSSLNGHLHGKVSDVTTVRAGVLAMVLWLCLGVVLGLAGARRLAKAAAAERNASEALREKVRTEDTPEPATS